MESDGFYSIGASHTVCQDYARGGVARGRVSNYALVSDGCSGSEDTDLGARFLVHAAERRLRVFEENFDPQWIARRAAMAASLFGADPLCLDATLLSAFVVDNRHVHITVAGDGFVAAKRNDGALVSWEFSDGGAPAYLSYTLNDRRMKAYLDAGYGTRRITQRIDGVVCNEQEQVLCGSDFTTTFSLDIQHYDFLLLMSDGASSFEGPNVRQQDVVEELCAIKSTRGSFVQRRCRRFLGKFCKTREWVHQDDLAVAGLYLREENP